MERLWQGGKFLYQQHRWSGAGPCPEPEEKERTQWPTTAPAFPPAGLATRSQHGDPYLKLAVAASRFADEETGSREGSCLGQTARGRQQRCLAFCSQSPRDPTPRPDSIFLAAGQPFPVPCPSTHAPGHACCGSGHNTWLGPQGVDMTSPQTGWAPRSVKEGKGPTDSHVRPGRHLKPQEWRGPAQC